MSMAFVARGRRVLWTAIVIAWIGFCALQYHLAATRADECLDELSGGQQDICIRHAIEGRDDVLLWGLGIPLGLVIIASFMGPNSHLLGWRQPSVTDKPSG